MNKALVIIGHGSKSKESLNEFDKIVELVKNRSDFNLVKGVLMKQPENGVEKIVEDIVSRHIKHITIMPYFLFSGSHTLSDIPEIVSILKMKYPDITFKLGNHIGFDPDMVGIILKRAKEADNE
jgi:sirohydrochlorin ferrochelatase